MQTQPTSQLLQIVETIADRSLGPKPIRLRLPDRWADLDLD